MTQRVVVTLVCDVEGEGKHEGPVESHSVVIDGVSKDLDTCTRHGKKLNAAKALAAKYGRRHTNKKVDSHNRTAASETRNSQIRAWAKLRGYEVNERGRIPAKIIAEYDATQGGATPITSGALKSA